MLAVKTNLKNAEKVKNHLIKNNLINHDYLPVKEFDSIFFPLNETFKGSKTNKSSKAIKIPNAEVLDTKIKFDIKPHQKTIEVLLKDKLTKSELKLIPKSQEMVGKIMILEVPEELAVKEKVIAEAYLQLNKQIETIVKKERMHEGVYRTRKVKILAGKKTKETIHLENGVKIKLHLEKTYFSARSGNERMRIANLVKPGEEILVMFSGAGPYPLVLAKHTEAKKIVGIELNILAHKYAVDNVTLNNFDDKINIFYGDVRKLVPKMKQKFDRILMPLPKTSEEFLDIALPKVKKNGMIHLYAFFNIKDLKEETQKIINICNKLKFKVKIIRTVKCGQFSPGTFRWCFDLKKVNYAL
ncbi:MAG: class I SAM-dependent methyltransferase family protein [Candidatus Woesearchaeota archaeon]